MAQHLFSSNAERALLGALMRADAAWWRVQGRIERADFAVEAHAALFDVIAQCREADQPADVVTVHEAGGGEIAWLGEITEAASAPDNAAGYADMVRSYAQRRRALAALDSARSRIEGGDDVADVMAATQGELEQVQSAGHEYRDMRGVIDETAELIDEAMRRREVGGLNGFATGVPSLDSFLGGISGARLYVIAGRPSLGKTALAHQVALNAARNGHPVGRIDLEMSYGEIGQRTVAHEYGISFTALVHGDQDATSRMNQRLKDRPISNLPIFMDADTYQIGAIIGRIAEWRHKHGIELAIVDHLQIVHAEGSNKNEALGNATAALKRASKRLGIPIIIVSQLSRDNAKQARRPRLEDLRDSGNIEQDIDVAIAINADIDDGETPEREVEIGLIKNRQGKTGWLARDLVFHGRTQSFVERTHEREALPEAS